MYLEHQSADRPNFVLARDTKRQEVKEGVFAVKF
jgi:hypothetical protein